MLPHHRYIHTLQCRTSQFGSLGPHKFHIFRVHPAQPCISRNCSAPEDVQQPSVWWWWCDDNDERQQQQQQRFILAATLSLTASMSSYRHTRTHTFFYLTSAELSAENARNTDKTLNWKTHCLLEYTIYVRRTRIYYVWTGVVYVLKHWRDSRLKASNIIVGWAPRNKRRTTYECMHGMLGRKNGQSGDLNGTE